MHSKWILNLVLCFAFMKICPSKSLKKNNDSQRRECPTPAVTSKNDTELEEENSIDFPRGITEVKFNGLIGKMETRKFCKLKCINGEWVGPLCLVDGGSSKAPKTSKEEKFLPLYKGCGSAVFLTKFVLTYKNKTILDDREFEHNTIVQVRCKEFGIYKLIGDSHLKCENGEWKTRIPSCIPTSSLKNYSDDSAPPTVLAKVTSGSANIEPSGSLAVYPGSIVHLECLHLRTAGDPEWSWTSTYRTYDTGWAIAADERDWKYLLSIYYIKPQDTGIYTCATPKGKTHSIVLNVIAVHCDATKVISTDPNLLTQVKGSRLGQQTDFSCREGFKLNGTANMTCQSSGQWSGYTPQCIPMVCPDLQLTKDSAKLVRAETGFGGQAVFQCPFGHKLIGSPTLTCNQGEKWSGPVPTCKEIFCPPPLIPVNAKLEYGNESASYPFRVGAVLTFSCQGVYQLVGESKITCQDSGFWSNPPPFCKTKCAHPGDPPNGKFNPQKPDYDVGDRITLSCFTNFEPSSKSRPRCQKNGLWTETGFECRQRRTFKLFEKKLPEDFLTTTTTTTTTTSTTTPATTTITSTTSTGSSTTPNPPTITNMLTSSPITPEAPIQNGTDNSTENRVNSTDIYYVVEEQPLL